nr:M23 family metallopeptidase [Neobacillus sp. Marseille-Q6967]
MIVRITSKFGSIDSAHKTPHSGVDLTMPEGTPLRAIGEGVIDRIYDGTGAIGKGLSIRFPDGTRTIYGHLSEVKARIGEHVQPGKIIGLSGNTGNSTGPHLHLGMKSPDGSSVNPTSWVDRVIANGRVGDGYGDIQHFSAWEWLGEKIKGFAVDDLADYLADFIVVSPIIAVVGAGVYCLINMFSKKAAIWGVIATVVYGLFNLK